MTSRTVREASGLQSLTSTLYLRLGKTDRDASFHCSVHYLLPKGQHGRLDSPPFGLTLHCESMLALLSHLGPHTSLRPDPPSAPPHTLSPLALPLSTSCWNELRLLTSHLKEQRDPTLTSHPPMHCEPLSREFHD